MAELVGRYFMDGEQQGSSPSAEHLLCILTILFIVVGNGMTYFTGELRHRSLAANTTILASLACLMLRAG